MSATCRSIPFIIAVIIGLSACNTPGNNSAADTGKTEGQNAFTRAVKAPVADVLTPVTNPHTAQCNSVVECRKYGGDLETVWQVNNTTDRSPKDYPGNCYKLGDGGKYYYSAAACHSARSR